MSALCSPSAVSVKYLPYAAQANALCIPLPDPLKRTTKHVPFHSPQCIPYRIIRASYSLYFFMCRPISISTSVSISVSLYIDRYIYVYVYFASTHLCILYVYIYIYMYGNPFLPAPNNAQAAALEKISAQASSAHKERALALPLPRDFSSHIPRAAFVP